LVCTTVRKEKECPFMTQKGCSYNGGICHEVAEECKGCNRSTEFSSGWYCTTFPNPSIKWKNGECSLASHITSVSTSKKNKINPLKASKRGKQ